MAEIMLDWGKVYLVALLLLLAVGPMAMADTVYQTDFSTDPGWTTDQLGNYYWDSANQTYHVRAENQSPGYTPSRYSYHLLSQSLDSFELSWDINPSSVDWSAGLMFGLYDSTLMTGGTGQPGTTQFIQGFAGRSDGGFHWGIYYAGADGQSSEWDGSGSTPVYDQWYTCEIAYVGATQMASFTVKEQGAVSSLYSTTFQVSGGFTNDLLYLGTSRGGIGDNGTYPGLSQYAVAVGSLDNVVLTPEPGTMSLLALAGMAMLRRRKIS